MLFRSDGASRGRERARRSSAAPVAHRFFFFAGAELFAGIGPAALPAAASASLRGASILGGVPTAVVLPVAGAVASALLAALAAAAPAATAPLAASPALAAAFAAASAALPAA